MIEFVPKEYYTIIFYWAMFSFCILTGLYYLTAPGCQKLLRQNSIILPLILTIIITIYIGLRPVSGKYFGDMLMYNFLWNHSELYAPDKLFDFNSEWFFKYILKLCKLFFNSSAIWFLIIDVIYIGAQFWACKKLLWENVWLAILFVFFSYQFFTFGVNGVRNGMGCALMMLSIAYFCDRNRKGYLLGTFFFILAMGCHRSVIVPMFAFLMSFYIVKDIKKALFIWVGCIFLSLYAGTYFQSLIASIGFDYRMAAYTTNSSETMAQFSHTGFRWDFLLYSAMPVWLAWYVMDKGINDKTFNLIANTYILANSFWVLICRVAYSNRFAYLSWFLYALVIAYVVVRIPVWKNQDRIAGWILLAHSSFTLVMHLIGK